MEDSRCQAGNTVAVLYPYRHMFLDMTSGIRVEESDSVKVSDAATGLNYQVTINHVRLFRRLWTIDCV